MLIESQLVQLKREQFHKAVRKQSREEYFKKNRWECLKHEVPLSELVRRMSADSPGKAHQDFKKLDIQSNFPELAEQFNILKLLLQLMSRDHDPLHSDASNYMLDILHQARTNKLYQLYLNEYVDQITALYLHWANQFRLQGLLGLTAILSIYPEQAGVIARSVKVEMYFEKPSAAFFELLGYVGKHYWAYLDDMVLIVWKSVESEDGEFVVLGLEILENLSEDAEMCGELLNLSLVHRIADWVRHPKKRVSQLVGRVLLNLSAANSRKVFEFGVLDCVGHMLRDLVNCRQRRVASQILLNLASQENSAHVILGDDALLSSIQARIRDDSPQVRGALYKALHLLLQEQPQLLPLFENTAFDFFEVLSDGLDDFDDQPVSVSLASKTHLPYSPVLNQLLHEENATHYFLLYSIRDKLEPLALSSNPKISSLADNILDQMADLP